MKTIATLLLAGSCALGVGGNVFAAQQSSASGSRTYLDNEPEVIKKRILFFITRAPDFITAVNNAQVFAGISEAYKTLAIEALKNRFIKNKEEAQNQLIKLSENGTLNPLASMVLIDAKVDLNNQDDDGYTALMQAAAKGNKKIVQMLIDAKVDLNKRDKKGYTALILAVLRGHKEIVQMLIDAKADLNIKDSMGITALIWAAFAEENKNMDIVQMLINAGADLNNQDDDGYTALMWASSRGNKEIVELLINKKADLNKHDADDNTALSLAIRNGHIEIVKLLIKAGAEG